VAVKSARIVISTWGSLGDLYPYLALAVELIRRGHRASIATISAWRDHVERAGVGFHAVGPEVPADEGAAREMVRRVLDAREGPRYLFEEVLGPSTRESYEALLAAVESNGGADLLVSHQIPLTGPVVAEAAGIRWVSGVVAPLAFFSVFDPPTPAQAPWLHPVLAWHPSIPRLANRLARRITDRWVQPVARLRARLGLPTGRSPLFEGQHSPWLVLALYSRHFADKQHDYPPQTIVTGFPFFDAAEQHPPSPELMKFLDDGKPPLLFTLGSSAVWIAGDFYKESIEAAVALGQRALLLAGEDAAGLRERGLPPGVAAFDYAPHSLVMPRAAVNVHQGGIGTTGQALRSGRPMLVVPFAHDQPDNARRCVSLGTARTIGRSSYTRSRVTKELSRLLDDPSYTSAAARVGSAISAERGTVTACDAIEAVLPGTEDQKIRR
jgi:UDP:flavonoid glycosyltransferase YjiC (YdhE family)